MRGVNLMEAKGVAAGFIYSGVVSGSKRTHLALWVVSIENSYCLQSCRIRCFEGRFHYLIYSMMVHP